MENSSNVPLPLLLIAATLFIMFLYLASSLIKHAKEKPPEKIKLGSSNRSASDKRPSIADPKIDKADLKRFRAAVQENSQRPAYIRPRSSAATPASASEPGLTMTDLAMIALIAEEVTSNNSKDDSGSRAESPIDRSIPDHSPSQPDSTADFVRSVVGTGGGFSGGGGSDYSGSNDSGGGDSGGGGGGD